MLRPDVFVGGPAEVAYYAQIAPLHELLGVPMPRVALRGHVLVAPKRVARAFDRYDIEPAEVFAAPDAILAEREPESVARVHEHRSKKAKRELMQRIAQIGELALPADHSLARSIKRSIGHLEFHFNKLGERADQRPGAQRPRALRRRSASSWPRSIPTGTSQDRIVGWFAYWQRLRSRTSPNA